MTVGSLSGYLSLLGALFVKSIQPKNLTSRHHIPNTFVVQFSPKDEELTAEEVLKRLEEAWSNEKNAPDLLEPKMEVGLW